MCRKVRSLFLVSAISCLAMAQNSVTVASDANNPARPLSTLLGQLRKQERIPVTYEDPHYASRKDMEGKAITATYFPQEIHNPEGPETVLSRILRDYSAAGGLTFALVVEGARLHVVPNEVLRSDGTRIRQSSILDTTISIPAARRNGGELLQAICDEIQKQTGYAIDIGPSVPGNYLARYSTHEAVTNVSARAALQELLDHATPKAAFVWDLYFDPADGGYGLNFAYVGPAGPAEKNNH